MQGITKNKLFIGAVCLVLAAVLSFVLLPKLYENELSTTQVIVLNQAVEEGSLITKDMLKTIEVGAFGLPSNIAQSAEQVVGMVAATAIFEGEYLSKNRLVKPDEYKNETVIEDGKVLLSLKLPSAASGLVGVLRAGDLVDVYTTVEDENSAITTKKALTSILVKEVLNKHLENLNDLDKDSENPEVGDDDKGDYEPSFIVVMVDEEQTKTLIALEKAENFHLTLAKAGD